MGKALVDVKLLSVFKESKRGKNVKYTRQRKMVANRGNAPSQKKTVGANNDDLIMQLLENRVPFGGQNF